MKRCWRRCNGQDVSANCHRGRNLDNLVVDRVGKKRSRDAGIQRQGEYLSFNNVHSNMMKLQVVVKTCSRNVSLSQIRGLKPKYSLSRILWGRCCLVARRCSGVVLHLRGLGVGFSYKCDQSKRRQPACQATTVRPGEKNQMTPP